MQDSDIAHRVFVSVNMSDTAEIIGQLQLADTQLGSSIFIHKQR